MGKMTVKFKKALETANLIRLPVLKSTPSEDVYTSLEKRGWWWNGSGQRWSDEPRPRASRRPLNAPAFKAPGMVELRVVADDNQIEHVCERLITQMRQDGWRLLSISNHVYGMRDEDGGGTKRGRAYQQFMLPTGE